LHPDPIRPNDPEDLNHAKEDDDIVRGTLLIAPVRDKLDVGRVNEVGRRVFNTIIKVKDLGSNRKRRIPGAVQETYQDASERLVIKGNCI